MKGSRKMTNKPLPFAYEAVLPPHFPEVKIPPNPPKPTQQEC